MSKATEIITLKPWTSVSSSGSVTITSTITPKVYAGVTVSGQTSSIPAPTPSPWQSLDSSGIPYSTTQSYTVTDKTTSTLNPSPTPLSADTVFLQTSAPVLGCWSERELPSDLGAPFCTPANGTELVLGETYFVTWNPTYFSSDINDVPFVQIIARSLSIDDDDDLIFKADNITNAYGYYPLTITSLYTQTNTGGYFYIDISPLLSPNSKATHSGTVKGPIVRAIASADDALYPIARVPSDNVLVNNHSGSGGLSRAGKIVIGVVVPLAGIFVISVLVYMFIYRNKGSAVRNVFSSRGYAIRSSKRQRLRLNQQSIELGSLQTTKSQQIQS
ncbi:hypothetical protein V1511DRAFT_489250 [Dipodascopsis uninucleata]